MRRIYLIAALGILLSPALASAQSPFDGTWKWQADKADWSKKPDVYVLQNGIYQCKTACVPPIDVKADGTDQKVTGHPYFDTMAVKVVNDHEIEITQKKNGKIVSTNKVTVSPDGKTLTFDFSDSSNSNGAPITGKGEETRVAPGPPGSSPISGSWQMAKLEDMSDNGLMWTWKVNGDELTMTSPTGQSFTAKMDGTEAPMKGDPGITTVSVKKIGNDTLQETDKRGPKVIAVIKSTVTPDGKTMHIVYEDKQSGQTSRSMATKE